MGEHRLDKPKLGATGRYPQGKLSPDDEGELAIAVAWDPYANMLRVEFGKPVAWLALSAERAAVLASMILKKIPSNSA